MWWWLLCFSRKHSIEIGKKTKRTLANLLHLWPDWLTTKHIKKLNSGLLGIYSSWPASNQKHKHKQMQSGGEPSRFIWVITWIYLRGWQFQTKARFQDHTKTVRVFVFSEMVLPVGVWKVAHPKLEVNKYLNQTNNSPDQARSRQDCRCTTPVYIWTSMLKEK